MASTKRIDLFITSNSTKERIIDVAYKRANKRDNYTSNIENNVKKYAHYYDVTHLNTGLKYMVFGDDAQDILSGVGTSVDILDKQEFIKGYTKDTTISSPDGTVNIAIDSDKPYNVFTQVKDNLQAIARIENEETNSFNIVLYDAEAYSEDKIKLDCSENEVVVNYIIVFE